MNPVIATMMMFAAPIQQGDLHGTVGLCIRWDGPEHVGDVVVVVSSGNPALDAAMAPTIQAMKWPRPDPPHDREWMPMNFAINGPTEDRPLPNCSKYPLPRP